MEDKNALMEQDTDTDQGGNTEQESVSEQESVAEQESVDEQDLDSIQALRIEEEIDDEPGNDLGGEIDDEEESDNESQVIIPQVLYPPVVKSIETLGYLKDTNRYRYSRQSSPCFSLGGRTYILFGDSQVNDYGVPLNLVAHNGVAIVRDKARLLESSYLNHRRNGVVEPLIRLTNGELNLPKEIRVALWGFGGAVETEPDEGLMWYEICEIVESEEDSSFFGVGIAKLSVKNAAGKLEATRYRDLVFGSPTDRLSRDGSKHIIFSANEPRFGSFSCILEGDFIYLWGGLGDFVFLARVEKENPDMRAAYTYWNGHSYVSDLREAFPVLNRVQYGGFFKSALFGEERPWIFVGNKEDGTIVLAAEKKLEGPWALHPIHVATNIHGMRAEIAYAAPQPWGSDEEMGELFITWSEPFPGGVIGAKVTLDTGDLSATNEDGGSLEEK